MSCRPRHSPAAPPLPTPAERKAQAQEARALKEALKRLPDLEQKVKQLDDEVKALKAKP